MAALGIGQRGAPGPPARSILLLWPGRALLLARTQVSSGRGGAHLGGHCQTAGTTVRRRFDNLPAHSHLRLRARYHFIDSWEGETAFLQIDGDGGRWTRPRARAEDGARSRPAGCCPRGMPLLGGPPQQRGRLAVASAAPSGAAPRMKTPLPFAARRQSGVDGHRARQPRRRARRRHQRGRRAAPRAPLGRARRRGHAAHGRDCAHRVRQQPGRARVRRVLWRGRRAAARAVMRFPSFFVRRALSTRLDHHRTNPSPPALPTSRSSRGAFRPHCSPLRAGS